MKYEMRLVTWLDSVGSQGAWRLRKEAAEYTPQECNTVGFVISETDEHVTLVQSCDNQEGDEERVDHFLVIPKPVIKKSKVLR